MEALYVVFVFVLLNLSSKCASAIICCRPANIVKIWLRKNCSILFNYKEKHIYRTLFLYLSILLFFLAFFIILLISSIAQDRGTIDEHAFFLYSTGGNLCLFMFIYWCYVSNKLHQCASLLVILLLGFFIPFIVRYDIYTFKLNSLFTVSGSYEITSLLMDNLYYTYNDFSSLGVYPFASIFWYESLWTIYFRSLRFNERFSGVVRFFIFLILLLVTFNFFVMFYFFCLPVFSISVTGMFLIYLQWFVLIYNMLLLFR